MQKDFSYIVTLDDIPAGEGNYIIKAKEEDLKFLTALLNVPKVKSFEAKMTTKYNRKSNVLNVYGFVAADLTLQSVISLEEFDKKYTAKFDVNFDSSPKVLEEFNEEIEDDFDEEIVESVVDGKIDLAAVAIEQLSLILDDYPKKDGESFSFKAEFEPEERPNPFAVLATLKK